MGKAQSIEVTCEAMRAMQSGLMNYFLEIDPSIPMKAEYLLMMVRPDQLGLRYRGRYRVTFEEIGAEAAAA